MNNAHDLFNFNPAICLNFFSQKFREGASYATLNTTRSALSLLISPDSGQDCKLKRFFKGIYKLRPARPKYKVTWDPSLVLNHFFFNLPASEELSLEVLTKKLVT